MRCPGQDSQYWKADAIYDVPCPQCGEAVEFFKDDSARVCPACKTRFANPKLDFGCASYCPHASQCVGLQEERKDEQPLKDILVQTVKRYVGDNKLLWQNLCLRGDAVEQLAREEGVSVFTVLGLSYLHSLNGETQEAVCRVFEEMNIELTDFKDLLLHRNLNAIEWRLIEDSEKIVGFSDLIRHKDKKELKNLAGLCHTESGRRYFLQHADD